jgi:hypothetical protein
VRATRIAWRLFIEAMVLFGEKTVNNKAKVFMGAAFAALAVAVAVPGMLSSHGSTGSTASAGTTTPHRHLVTPQGAEGRGGWGG